jgi:hypothetical protein
VENDFFNTIGHFRRRASLPTATGAPQRPAAVAGDHGFGLGPIALVSVTINLVALNLDAPCLLPSFALPTSEFA